MIQPQPNSKDRPTAEQVRALLYYEPETGILRWKARPDNYRWTKQFAGKVAGSANKISRYVELAIFDVNYLAHRVIWVWVQGEWPSHQIDHVNRDRSDNRIANLRHVTASGNSRNKSVYANRTTGLTGTCFRKNQNKWEARITVRGHQQHLGTFATTQEAHAAHLAAKQVLHAVEEI